MFASRARCRTAGLASALVPGARATAAGAGVAGAGVATGSGAAFASSFAAAGAFFAGAGFSFFAGASSEADAFPAPSTSNSMQTTPTGRISPASPMTLVTFPSTGMGFPPLLCRS